MKTRTVSQDCRVVLQKVKLCSKRCTVSSGDAHPVIMCSICSQWFHRKCQPNGESTTCSACRLIANRLDRLKGSNKGFVVRPSGTTPELAAEGVPMGGVKSEAAVAQQVDGNSEIWQDVDQSDRTVSKKSLANLRLVQDIESLKAIVVDAITSETELQWRLASDYLKKIVGQVELHVAKSFANSLEKSPEAPCKKKCNDSWENPHFDSATLGPTTPMIDDSFVAGNDPPKAEEHGIPSGLSINKSGVSGADQGIFADVVVSVGTVFVPYGEKKVWPNSTKVMAGGSSWKIVDVKKISESIDGNDLGESNWMRFINYSNSANLAAFQFREHILYRAIKDIEKGSELLICKSQLQRCAHLREDRSPKHKSIVGSPLLSNTSAFPKTKRQQLSPTQPPALLTLLTGQSTPSTLPTRPTSLLKLLMEPSTLLMPATGPSTPLMLATGPSTPLMPATVPSTPLMPATSPSTPLMPATGPSTSLMSATGPSIPATLPTKPSALPSERRFLCSICGFAQKTSGNLREHQFNKHGITVVFGCQTCQIQFNFRAQLWSHQEELGHSGIDRRLVGPNDEIFDASTMSVDGQACMVSPLPEKSERLLPHKCIICQTSFRRVYALRRHQQKEHGIFMLYKCKACDEVEETDFKKFREHQKEKSHKGMERKFVVGRRLSSSKTSDDWTADWHLPTKDDGEMPDADASIPEANYSDTEDEISVLSEIGLPFEGEAACWNFDAEPNNDVLSAVSDTTVEKNYLDDTNLGDGNTATNSTAIVEEAAADFTCSSNTFVEHPEPVQPPSKRPRLSPRVEHLSSPKCLACAECLQVFKLFSELRDHQAERCQRSRKLAPTSINVAGADDKELPMRGNPTSESSAKLKKLAFVSVTNECDEANVMDWLDESVFAGGMTPSGDDPAPDEGDFVIFPFD